MTPPSIETDLVDGVLSVRMARPEKMNALGMREIDLLASAFAEASDNPQVRCVLLSGAGRGFCSGRDISDAEPGEDAAAFLNERINPMLAALYDCPKPTVAAVNGAAMGIGLGLALACDLVYAGEGARFSSPFGKLGGALDSGGHYLLPQRLPIGRVFELIYTSEAIGGAEAVRLGLADRLAPDGVLQAAARRLAMQIAAGPQTAFVGQKAILRRAAALGYRGVLSAEAALQGSLAHTPEYAEGIAAFNSKRAPDFRAASAANLRGEGSQ